MKKTIRNTMMILAGVSMIFAAAGNAAADEMVNVAGIQISKADFLDIKARVAGEPAGNRVYAQKSETANLGGIELGAEDAKRIKALVAGDASLADASVYARSPETVDLGIVTLEKADFDAIKAQVSGGPVVRLAQRIHSAEALN